MLVKWIWIDAVYKALCTDTHKEGVLTSDHLYNEQTF